MFSQRLATVENVRCPIMAYKIFFPVYIFIHKAHGVPILQHRQTTCVLKWKPRMLLSPIQMDEQTIRKDCSRFCHSSWTCDTPRNLYELKYIQHTYITCVHSYGTWYEGVCLWTSLDYHGSSTCDICFTAFKL